MDTLHSFVGRMFPTAVLMERFGERVTYRVPQESVGPLSKVFSTLEQGQSRVMYIQRLKLNHVQGGSILTFQHQG